MSQSFIDQADQREHLVDIARVAHEANRSYCQTLGDESQKPWEEAEQWQRDSALSGVQFLIANPDADRGILHQNWVDEKIAAGWKYGPVKDADKKEHPCLVKFDELSTFQQKKDDLFMAVVKALL